MYTGKGASVVYAMIKDPPLAVSATTTALEHQSQYSMIIYFHTDMGGDILWFENWRPTSILETLAVCLAVALLAGFERWLTAQRRILGVRWNSRYGQVIYCPVGRIRLMVSRQDEDRPLESNWGQGYEQRWKRLTLASFSPSSPSPSQSQSTNANANANADLGNGIGIRVGLMTSPMIFHQPFSPISQATDDQTPLRWSNPDYPIDHEQITNPDQSQDHQRQPWHHSFRWKIDLTRGGLQAFQTAIHYLLMSVQIPGRILRGPSRTNRVRLIR